MQLDEVKLVEKAEREFQKHAKEPIDVEIISGCYYGFGSELACLRLYYKYRHSGDIGVGYSTNRGTWYFSLEGKWTEEF